jgi:hypothetical protein
MDKLIIKLKVLRNYAIAFKQKITPVNANAALELLISTIDNFINAYTNKGDLNTVQKFMDIVINEKELACKYLQSSMFKDDICQMFDDCIAILDTIKIKEDLHDEVT